MHLTFFSSLYPHIKVTLKRNETEKLNFLFQILFQNLYVMCCFNLSLELFYCWVK